MDAIDNKVRGVQVYRTGRHDIHSGALNHSAICKRKGKCSKGFLSKHTSTREYIL